MIKSVRTFFWVLLSMGLATPVFSAKQPYESENSVYHRKMREEEALVRQFFYECEKDYYRSKTQKSMLCCLGFIGFTFGSLLLDEACSSFFMDIDEMDGRSVSNYSRYFIAKLAGIWAGLFSALAVKTAVESYYYGSQWLKLVRKPPIHFKY